MFTSFIKKFPSSRYKNNNNLTIEITYYIRHGIRKETLFIYYKFLRKTKLLDLQTKLIMQLTEEFTPKRLPAMDGCPWKDQRL